MESILGLAQKIGANPSKFMGTKSNINFLGTGDKAMKGTTFSGQINDDFLNLGFGKNDMIKIIEQDAGYMTAGKLNDSQLNTMFNNLKMVDKTFNPPALPPGPMNIIDLETGTRGINKEGLESLRETDKIKRFTKGLGTSKTAMSNKIKEGIDSLKTKLTGGGDDIATKATAEDDFIRSGAADFGDSVAAEGGRRAVVRQLLSREPDLFMLPPEMAESIAKSKDLGKGGSNFPDPLIVFRNKGNFTRQELEQIDEIIEASPFDDVKNIADKVSDYLQTIRPEGFTSGFAEGGRIGYSSGRSVKEMLNAEPPFDSSDYFGKAADYKKSPFAIPDNFLEKLMEYLKRDKKAEGGRIGYRSGKSVKEGIAALLKLGNKKFGKDKIKTVENEPEFFDNMEVSPYFNIKRPEAAIRRDQFKNFGKPGKFNEDGTIDYDYYAQILNDVENDFVTGGESIEKLEKMLKTRLDEQAYMYDQFITGKLDPKKGESGRESFLQKKLDEVESSGDRRLITLDELDELDELKGGPGRPPGFTERKSRVPNNIPMEMMTARTIKAKYPQASDELIEMIVDLPNDKKALALADLDQVMFLEESGRSADEIITILKSEPKTKMKKGGLARILEM